MSNLTCVHIRVDWNRDRADSRHMNIPHVKEDTYEAILFMDDLTVPQAHSLFERIKTEAIEHGALLQEAHHNAAYKC